MSRSSRTHFSQKANAVQNAIIDGTYAPSNTLGRLGTASQKPRVPLASRNDILKARLRALAKAEGVKPDEILFQIIEDHLASKGY